MEKEKIFRNYIVSPSRGHYRESKKNEECIFCLVVKKLNKFSLPAVIEHTPVITAFDNSLVVVNEYPYVPKGHVMIATNRHIKDIEELNEEEVDEIFKVVIPKVKKSLEKEYKNVKGFNIGISMGKEAGASIEHFHIHLVPRFSGEVAFMETTASTRVLDESPETTMNKIAKYFKR